MNSSEREKRPNNARLAREEEAGRRRLTENSFIKGRVAGRRRCWATVERRVPAGWLGIEGKTSNFKIQNSEKFQASITQNGLNFEHRTLNVQNSKFDVRSWVFGTNAVRRLFG